MNGLAQHLLDLGVTDIYMGAGARNSSLINVFKDFNLRFFLDERIASFTAMGLAKSSLKPVVICTTSGTAVAECLPAMIESYYSDIPLIMISADRPARLRDSHSPQTINQVNIFSCYARTEFCGPLKEYKRQCIQYPFHINLEIDELSNDCEDRSTFPIVALNSEDFTAKFDKAKNVLAVFTESSENYFKELKLLDRLNCLIYIECTSDLKYYKSGNRIHYEKTILDIVQNKDIDLIIKFGRTPFTKLWRLLDNKYIDLDVVSYQNEKIGLGRGFTFNEIDCLSHSKEKYHINEVSHLSHCRLLPNAEINIYEQILKETSESDIIFIGNSMPIRYWHMVDRGNQKVYASRGANGIDGQIATAIGIANGTAEIVHCIVGDLTFLYDLSSCISKLPQNLIIHIVNNEGGRIFERVQVNNKMILPHNINIKELISGFKSKDQIREYISSQEETQAFWSSWGNE